MTPPRPSTFIERPAPTRAEILAGFVRLLWQQPLWAIPFAFFFGTMNGGTWPIYVTSYKIALVFAYVIRLTLWAVEAFVAPRVRRIRIGGVYPVAIDVALHLGAAVVASFAASGIVGATLMPGFYADWRGWVSGGIYAVIFAGLFGGVIYARVFYRQSLARAAQVERMRGDLARAELRALRAQIHPHFLFNTLNSIAALTRENPAAAEDLVTRLAEVFRHVLAASERERVRLREELAFVRDYLGIEQARLGDRLRAEERIEPGLEDVSIPSLLLQPLVENAVLHAIAPRREGGFVRIEAVRERDTLVVRVRDDGPGFDAAAPARGTGVGLASVRERMRLAGPPHAFALDTAPGRGTCVTLTLPLEPTHLPAPPEEGDVPCDI